MERTGTRTVFVFGVSVGDYVRRALCVCACVRSYVSLANSNHGHIHFIHSFIQDNKRHYVLIIDCRMFTFSSFRWCGWSGSCCRHCFRLPPFRSFTLAVNGRVGLVVWHFSSRFTFAFYLNAVSIVILFRRVFVHLRSTTNTWASILSKMKCSPRVACRRSRQIQNTMSEMNFSQ